MSQPVVIGMLVSTCLFFSCGPHFEEGPGTDETSIDEEMGDDTPPQQPQIPPESRPDPGPCPPQVVRLSIDGIEHVVTIPIGCEPMQDVYVGCPSPL